MRNTTIATVALSVSCVAFLALSIFATGGCGQQDSGVVVPPGSDLSSGIVPAAGMAGAPIGANWVKSANNPIITGGFSGGTFDALDVRATSVLYDDVEHIYKMWYSGLDNTSPPRLRIGYATSPDGITWTPHSPNPVIDLGPSGAFDDWHAYSPVVIKDGGTYKMWYTGDAFGRNYLGYATSPDGITWTKLIGTQALGSILDWQAKGWNRYTQATSVIKEGGLYKMWLGALEGDGGIGYATSSDGINWTILGQVLPIGPGGTFEEWRIHWPAVVKIGSQYVMIYAGQKLNELRRFGLATSPDGINWTKYSGNPVLSLGDPGDMDDVGHYYPNLLAGAGVLKMWYSGFGPRVAIGYAESVFQPALALDIKPGSCPNPINPKSRGKLPVAILGTAEFDVLDIDVSSLLLEGVAPIRSSVDDVSALLLTGNECDCAEHGPDGYDDLTLKFSTQDIVAAIGPVSPGDEKVLTITGTLLDGTPFEASDCVVVVGGEKNPPFARRN